MSDKAFVSIFAVPVTLSATVAAHRFVTPGGAYPSAAAAGFAVVRTGGVSGQMVTGDCLGSLIVETSGAVTKGNEVELGTSGRVVNISAGKAVGMATESASGAGEFIEILVR